MSGQPYRYAKDIENFRNEYMESLSLRANIDDMNFQANKIYKETGALPPKSTMKDMRTTAEILMDVEKLKLKIIGDFKGLATPQMVQLVIQRVESSPLNGDGSFFTWFAQNTPELVTQLKKKYSLGIEGNTNDAEQMYLFLQSTYNSTRSLNSSVKSAFDRPTNSANAGILPNDLTTLNAKYNEINYRLQTSRNTLPAGPLDVSIMRFAQEIKNKFSSLTRVMDTQRYNDMRDVFNFISNPANGMNQIAINQSGFTEWLKFTSTLPSAQSLSTILEQITKSLENENRELTVKLLTNLTSLLPEVSESTRMYNLTGQLIAANGGVAPVLPPAPPPAAGGVPAAGGPPLPSAGIMTSDYLTNLANGLNAIVNDNVNVVYTNAQFQQRINALLPQLEAQMDAQYPNWDTPANTDYSRAFILAIINSLTRGYDINYTNGSVTFGRGTLGTAIRNDPARLGRMVGANIGRAGRPRGSGIVKSISERIDNTQGIKQGHTHVPFGKYIINKNRLDDDIFSFKHVKGYGVKGYPSKKISRNLSNVIKTIIGGGVPKFNELSNLSEDEKEYLHIVSSKAGIMDKLSVPTPSKDSMEQDVHSFNVMKGEILAGNDSSVLIKKFKLLLLKLSKNGSLPKRECQEIMEDLIQLGY